MTNEEVIKKITGLLKFSTDEEKEALHKAIAALRNQQEWIPCSESLPELPEGIRIVTIQDKRDKERYTDIAFRFKDAWFVGGFCSEEVVAWMPLPEPYRGGDAG